MRLPAFICVQPSGPCSKRRVYAILRPLARLSCRIQNAQQMQARCLSDYTGCVPAPFICRRAQIFSSLGPYNEDARSAWRCTNPAFAAAYGPFYADAYSQNKTICKKYSSIYVLNNCVPFSNECGPAFAWTYFRVSHPCAPPFHMPTTVCSAPPPPRPYFHIPILLHFRVPASPHITFLRAGGLRAPAPAFPRPCPCTHAPSARPRPGPLHPCAQRPVPARSLAPVRPVPARSLAPMRPAPGPGPVPCTHAPSARVRVVFPLYKPARTGAKRCEKRVKKPDGKPSGFSHGAAPHLFCMPSLKPAPRPLCARSPPPSASYPSLSSGAPACCARSRRAS